MSHKKTPSLLLEAALWLVALLFLVPILYLFAMSFKRPAIFYNPIKLPDSFYIGYYQTAFLKMDIGQGFANSFLVTTGGLMVTIVSASLAGYIIARMKGKLFQICFFIILSGLIIPTVSSLIPLFKLAIAMNLINTRLLLVLIYSAGLMPIATFLYSAFTKSIPRELEESAAIDGCGRLSTFWRIIFPLLLPATGTFVITNVFGLWNDFITPQIFLNSPGKMTLMPQIVQFTFNLQSVNLGPVFALGCLAVLPLIVLFIFAQKHMLKGLVIGSMKG